MGHAGDFKNGRIWLKFGTLFPWVKSLAGLFFHFFKILIFRGVVTSFSPKKGQKLVGTLETLKVVRFGWLKFGTLVPWMNP